MPRRVRAGDAVVSVDVKRVLYVEANEDGTVGGSHKILFDLVTRLSPDFEPVVLFYEDNIWADRLKARGIETITWDAVREVERPGLQTGTKLSTVLTLLRGMSTRRRLLRDRHIDLVHLNNSPHVGYDDWLPASRLERVPCVVSAMGHVSRERSLFARFALRQFQAYFPLSRCVERGLVRNELDTSRITLTYPGVDLDEVDARVYRPRQEVRREFDVQDGQLLVTMVGNVRRWKGQHVVLRALAELEPEELRRLRVLFVGQRGESDAGYERELTDFMEARDLDGVVTFTGRREDVPDLLEATDIAIHASVEAEPFGLVVQEAMLHGCATVAADEGGPVEMMTEDSGFMFDADEPGELAAHLRTLLRDPDLRARVSERARRQARTFDVRDYVERIEGRYRELLGPDR